MREWGVKVADWVQEGFGKCTAKHCPQLLQERSIQKHQCKIHRKVGFKSAKYFLKMYLITVITCSLPKGHRVANNRINSETS